MSTRLITIFGGSGFIGQHLVGRLAAEGHQIRLAVRDTEKAATLVTQGNVGQIVGVQANIRNQASVERAVAGADVVINLVGLLYEAGAQSFNAVHEEGAACVAAAAKAAGVSEFVHMSALGADAASPSKYARTKAEGEAAVLAAFEGATIIRPSVVFGAGDNFSNKFAALGAISPAIPLLDGGKNQMQPVAIEDLADAIAKIVLNPEYQGKVWEFGGPDALALSSIIEIIGKVSKRSPIILPLPAQMMTMMGFFMGLIPGRPMLTTDQVKLLASDNVVSGDHSGFADLGIQPVPFSSTSLRHLTRFQKGGGYTQLHA